MTLEQCLAFLNGATVFVVSIVGLWVAYQIYLCRRIP